MARYVALLRGINVGKAKRIAMADLRALLESLDCTQVRTLLNSGNAVFSHANTSAPALAKKIQSAIAKTLGVDTFVIVQSDREIAAVVAENALAERAEDPSRLLVALAPRQASARCTGKPGPGGLGCRGVAHRPACGLCMVR